PAFGPGRRGGAAHESCQIKGLAARQPVKPIEAFQESFRAALSEHNVPGRSGQSAEMIEAAVARRLALHAAGALAAESLVTGKGEPRVCLALLEACRKRRRILHGEGRALSEIREDG